MGAGRRTPGRDRGERALPQTRYTLNTEPPRPSRRYTRKPTRLRPLKPAAQWITSGPQRSPAVPSCMHTQQRRKRTGPNYRSARLFRAGTISNVRFASNTIRVELHGLKMVMPNSVPSLCPTRGITRYLLLSHTMARFVCTVSLAHSCHTLANGF